MSKLTENLKFTSSMNARDRQLLTILGLLILCFLTYYFVISPALDKNALLRVEEKSVKAEISKAETNIANLATMRLQDLKQKEDINKKYSIFFNELKTERLSYVIDTYLGATGFQPISIENSEFFVSPITFDPPEIKDYSYPLLDLALSSNKELFDILRNGINTNTDVTTDTDNVQNKESATTTDTNKETKKELAPDSVLNLDVTLRFEGSGYENMISFIKTLEGMNKAIAIKDITITKASIVTGIDGELVITLYSIRKVDSTENDYLVFLPQIPRGKGNPFN